VLYQDAKDVMSASPAGVVCTKHLIRCEGTVRYLAFSPRSLAHCARREDIVLRGEQLKATDANGKSDPYFVTKWIGGSGERSESVKSVVAPATLNPNWHQIATYSKKTNPPIMTTYELRSLALSLSRVIHLLLSSLVIRLQSAAHSLGHRDAPCRRVRQGHLWQERVHVRVSRL